jgi:hypothetical protein
MLTLRAPAAFVAVSATADPIHISFVACQTITEGISINRTAEALAMVKSALLTTSDPRRLHFHIFADEEVGSRLHAELHRTFISYRIYLADDTASGRAWRMIERGQPCAGLKLSLPTVLPSDVKRVLNVDTDVLFLRDVARLWQYFDYFNSTQVAALSAETEDAGPWYGARPKCRAPFYEPHGLNSGVVLLDLARCRAIGWSARLEGYHVRFHFERELVLRLPCRATGTTALITAWTGATGADEEVGGAVVLVLMVVSCGSETCRRT